MPETTYDDLRKQSLTGPQLGALLNLTRQRIGQLENENVLSRGADNRFPLIESVKAYLLYLCRPRPDL